MALLGTIKCLFDITQCTHNGVYGSGDGGGTNTPLSPAQRCSSFLEGVNVKTCLTSRHSVERHEETDQYVCLWYKKRGDSCVRRLTEVKAVRLTFAFFLPYFHHSLHHVAFKWVSEESFPPLGYTAD